MFGDLQIRRSKSANPVQKSMLFWWIFSQKIQKGILVGVVASIFFSSFWQNFAQ
jgi:hypothetical protein